MENITASTPIDVGQPEANAERCWIPSQDGPPVASVYSEYWATCIDSYMRGDLAKCPMAGGVPAILIARRLQAHRAPASIT